MEKNSQALGKSEGANNNCVQEARELRKAKEAVDKLGAGKFISDNENLIYRKLERCDIRVFKAKQNKLSKDRCIEGYECDMMFIADSLPLVTGIVHVGHETLNQAKDWVRELVPDADPISVLSALTLLYVAENGHNKYKDDPTMIEDAKDLGAEDLGKDASRKEVWKRIYKRVRDRFIP